MRCLVSGASGLIGSALRRQLTLEGHETVALVRRPAQPGELAWDSLEREDSKSSWEGFDAAVHLAGENIGSGRWTARKMQRIERSRIDGTQRLSAMLAKLDRPPSVLVCASAIGFYGDRGDAEVNERSPRGRGFLARVCDDWERATGAAQKRGLRVVHLRTGMVLDARAGGLAKMLIPFKLGLGGPMGNGQQWLSWITLGDEVRVLERCLRDGNLAGPVNAVSPSPVRFREFATTLGRVLHRPAFAPFPAFAARMLFGQMADELLLASTKVRPEALAKVGFAWEHPQLEGALRAVLGRTA
jgi:uncharacterized protein (TIGR01777 family)